MTATVIDMTDDQTVGQKKAQNRLVAVIMQQNGQLSNA